METVAAVKTRYGHLEGDRSSSLFRARECALYTIPMLVPPDGASASTRYPTPYQSLGARGVNNLSSKFVLSVFPPNTPCFRLAVDDFTLEKIAGKGARADVETALAKVERAVMTEIETTPTRAPAAELFKHLIVAGNVLAYMLPTGGLKVYRLDQYVVKRDPSGNVLEIITHERISPMEVPENIRGHLLGDSDQSVEGEKKKSDVNDTVDIYTHIWLTLAGWKINQEVNGKIVPGSEGSYPRDKSPWIALRFTADTSSDYGRGLVEEYLGDLKSLEGLTKSLVQAAAVAAKVLFLVKPNSTTDVKDISEKESGGFAVGNKDDITVLSLEKYADFKVALEMRSQLIESLSFSFLLNTAVQRKGERVTAEEIRFMANELDAGLGGFYSTISQEFQLPFVTRKMHTMQAAGKLPRLPSEIVKPMITTGIDAIGRGNDLTKLAGLLQDLQPLGREAIASNMNVADYIKRCAAARGIDTDGLIPSPEEIAQRQQQEQMQTMAQTLGPNAVTQLGGMARDQMSAASAPAPQTGAP